MFVILCNEELSFVLYSHLRSLVYYELTMKTTMKSKKYGGNKTINILNEISAGLFMSSFHSPALHTVTPIDRKSFNTHKQTLFMTTDTYG